MPIPFHHCVSGSEWNFHHYEVHLSLMDSDKAANMEERTMEMGLKSGIYVQAPMRGSQGAIQVASCHHRCANTSSIVFWLLDRLLSFRISCSVPRDQSAVPIPRIFAQARLSLPSRHPSMSHSMPWPKPHCRCAGEGLQKRTQNRQSGEAGSPAPVRCDPLPSSGTYWHPASTTPVRPEHICTVSGSA